MVIQESISAENTKAKQKKNVRRKKKKKKIERLKRPNGDASRRDAKKKKKEGRKDRQTDRQIRYGVSSIYAVRSVGRIYLIEVPIDPRLRYIKILKNEKKKIK
ncbi:hypothetical protein K0M31_009560 [Melipona bicolor]|uniref:Uncharacterized protein n=1 Tax=Melipona bicolor TaxID=60889 RepID=A0AA40FNF6_9HYME|nr:hypothetical protein K0M31_009560 [Melipona bicolor]